MLHGPTELFPPDRCRQFLVAGSRRINLLLAKKPPPVASITPCASVCRSPSFPAFRRPGLPLVHPRSQVSSSSVSPRRVRLVKDVIVLNLCPPINVLLCPRPSPPGLSSPPFSGLVCLSYLPASKPQALQYLQAASESSSMS